MMFFLKFDLITNVSAIDEYNFGIVGGIGDALQILKKRLMQSKIKDLNL